MGSKKKGKQKPKKIKSVEQKQIEITEDSSVKCQWCRLVNTAKKWNDITYEQCISREMRRAFRSIYDMQVWGKDSDHFYKCPSCNIWSRGNQLILIDDEGNNVSGIGGQPISL